MATGRSFDAFTYVLDREKDGVPREQQTIWKLRPLRYSEMQSVMDTVIHTRGEGDISIQVNELEKARKILTFGLIGWSNYKTQSGEEIEFRKVDEGGRKILPEEMLDYIVDDAVELANACESRSKLPKDKAKNS